MALGSPTGFEATLLADSIEVTWQPPTHPDVVGATIFYRDISSNSLNQATITDTTYARLSEFELGHHYEFWVQYLDYNGFHGPKSDVIDLTVASSTQNNLPYFTMDPEEDWIFTEDESHSYLISASDADGEPLSYTLEDAPPGMILSGNTVTWTPEFTEDSSFDYSVLLIVNDQSGGADSLFKTYELVSQIQLEKSIRFSSPTLHAEDNAYIIIENYSSSSTVEYVLIENLSSGQSETIPCQRVNDFEFIGDLDLVETNRTINISDGDTLKALYQSESESYEAFCLYSATPQHENNAPLMPTNPDPVNLEYGVNPQPQLSWSGGDIDNDIVFYDIYLGTSNPPTTQLVLNQAVTSYALTSDQSLEERTTYYWRVVARDSRGAETEGPVWQFTTFIEDPEEITVNGLVFESTTWSADLVHVNGDIIVPDGVTLTIEPGTLILFDGNYELEVLGVLSAVGTHDLEILFTSRFLTESWNGISIKPGNQVEEASRMTNCRFSHAQQSAVYIENMTNLRIVGCIFENNHSSNVNGNLKVYQKR